MARLLRVKTAPGKRAELIQALGGSHENRNVGGREVVIWAADPGDNDSLLIFEYWSDLEEFAAGSHSEQGANFRMETADLIVETSVVLEAAPVWTQGVTPPRDSRDPALVPPDPDAPQRPDGELMSAEEIAAYEKAVRMEVERQWHTLQAYPWERRKMHEVRLDGSYPDTKIHLQWVDPLMGEQSRSYELWRHPILRGMNWLRAGPEHEALLINTWASG